MTDPSTVPERRNSKDLTPADMGILRQLSAQDSWVTAFQLEPYVAARKVLVPRLIRLRRLQLATYRTADERASVSDVGEWAITGLGRSRLRG